MHAFIITVPVPLIEAVHFVISNHITDADAYVTKSFAGAEEIAERLRSTGVFQNVFLEEDVLLTYPITIKKCVRTVINGWGLVSRLKKRKYDYAYYNNSGWLINSIFYTGFIKGNPRCVQRFIEHGNNTYLNEYGNKSWKLRLMINLMGFRCMDGSMLEALYMFDPSLLKVRQDGEIRVMPSMDKNNRRFLETLNQSFAFAPTTNDLKDKQIIIMEQGPLKVDFDMEAFWNKVFEMIDTDRAIIKTHPRQKGSALQKSGIPVSSVGGIPWEVVALNMDLEEKTQITIFSGSCLTPKVCCGIESRVILLYKLLPVDYTFFGKQIVELTNEIGEKYIDRDKFFVPESFEELKAYCDANGLGPAQRSKDNRRKEEMEK